jgi:hypothetical protein
MSHTVKVELNITTVQKLDDASPEMRTHLIHEAAASRVDAWTGETIDRIGADGDSEYEITEATVIHVLDRDAFDIVEIEVIIERVEGKFAPRYELEDGVNELAEDLAKELEGEELGESGAFTITEATVEEVR